MAKKSFIQKIITSKGAWIGFVMGMLVALIQSGFEVCGLPICDPYKDVSAYFFDNIIGLIFIHGLIGFILGYILIQLVIINLFKKSFRRRGFLSKLFNSKFARVGGIGYAIFGLISVIKSYNESKGIIGFFILLVPGSAGLFFVIIPLIIIFGLLINLFVGATVGYFIERTFFKR